MDSIALHSETRQAQLMQGDSSDFSPTCIGRDPTESVCRDTTGSSASSRWLAEARGYLVSEMTDDVMSPELALVDPVAAARARDALPERLLFEDVVLRRNESRRETEAFRSMLADAEAHAIAVTDARRRRRRHRRVALATSAVAATLAVLVATAVGVWPLADRGSSHPKQTSAEHVRAKAGPVAPAPTTAKRTRAGEPRVGAAAGRIAGASARAARRSIPDFVWVAADGARAYRVEFSRAGRVVLSQTTTAARLRVDPSRLPSGRYRWRVWRLDRGLVPVGPAIVDAIVTIA